MRILLVNPPFSRLRGAGQAPYFPLGLGCLARAVPLDLAEVRILNCENPAPGEKRFLVDKETVYKTRSKSFAAYQNDLKNVNHPVWNEFSSILDTFQPDLIGLTVMTVNAGSAAVLTRLAKTWNKDVPVVWGGVHPTFETRACLAEEGVDLVIRGEGERSFVSYVETLAAGSPSLHDIPGISFLENGEFISTPDPDLIDDLDEVFPPRRDIDFFPERYEPLSWGSIMASRGCPWQCSFCSSPAFWRRRLRYRDPVKVVDEIAAIVQGGHTRHFTFWDDSFTANLKKIEELCRAIIDRGLKITWKTATRIDLIDDSLLELMRQAGCIQLQIGIETGSRRMSAIVTKDVDPFQSIEAIRRIKAHGIGAGAFFMAGFPSEREEDLLETFSLMKQIDADDIVLNVFDPMPGSASYKEVQERNLLPDPIDWKNFPLWPDRHFAVEIAPDRFNVILEEISGWIFRHNSGLKSKWRKNKPELLFLIHYDRPFLVKKIRLYLQAVMGHLLGRRALFSLLSRKAVLLAKWLFWRTGPAIISRLPLPLLSRLSDSLGSILYRVDGRRRRLIHEELSRLLSDRHDSAMLENETRTSFRNFVHEQMQAFHFPSFTKKKIERHLVVEGIEHVEASHGQKKGTIILTAHFGAHLLPILALHERNLPVFQLGTPPSAWEEMVGKTVGRLERYIFDRRHQLEQALPATFVFLSSTMREIFRILEHNGILIVAFDGRGGLKWKKVPFLGRRLQISPGPFHLAHSSGASIIPTFVVRQGDRDHVTFHEAIVLDPKQPREQETDRAVAAFISVFQDYVIRYPGHYGWLLQAARIRGHLDAFPLFVDERLEEASSSSQHKAIRP